MRLPFHILARDHARRDGTTVRVKCFSTQNGLRCRQRMGAPMRRVRHDLHHAIFASMLSPTWSAPRRRNPALENRAEYAFAFADSRLWPTKFECHG